MRRQFASILAIFVLVGFAFSAQKAAPKPQTDARPAPSQKAAPPEQKPAAPEAKGAAAGTLSEQTVDAFLQQMFGFDPNVKFKVAEIKPAKAAGLSEVTASVNTPNGTQQLRFFVTPDSKYAIAGELLPFGPDPFSPIREELKARQNGPARGPENAAVTIWEFSDLQCPSCKAAQPTIDRLLTDVPNARFVLQQYPLPMHNWAMKAANYADCLGRENNAALWKFVNLTYAQQEQINEANVDEKLKGLVTESGGEAAKVTACAADPATAERIKQSMALGKSLDVTGTPTLFVGGRKLANIGSVPYDLLKRMVEFYANKK